MTGSKKRTLLMRMVRKWGWTRWARWQWGLCVIGTTDRGMPAVEEVSQAEVLNNIYKHQVQDGGKQSNEAMQENMSQRCTYDMHRNNKMNESQKNWLIHSVLREMCSTRKTGAIVEYEERHTLRVHTYHFWTPLLDTEHLSAIHQALNM